MSSMATPRARIRPRWRAASLATLLLWTQACTVGRPIAPDQAIRPRAHVRADAELPVLLAALAGGLMARPLCTVRRVEGIVDRQVGDTLLFARVNRVAAVRGARASDSRERDCGPLVGIATMLRGSDLALSERRVSKGRTAALLIGIAAAALALAAYAASNIEYDWPSGIY